MSNRERPESPIHQRLTELINVLEEGLQANFARTIGVPTGTVGDLMGKKKSKPGFDLTGKILQAYPRIRPEWLLLGEGEMLKSETPESSSKNIFTAHRNPVIELHIEAPGVADNRLVPLINYKAAANYLTGYQSQELYEEVEMVSLPKLLLPGKQRYTIFPVVGESMEPTLWTEDLLLCQNTPIERWLDLRGENLMVVVSRSRGLIVKRVKVSKPLRALHCRSDNPRSVPFTLSLNDEGDHQPDVLELWMVEWYFTKRTEAPERQSVQRVDNLETQVDDLRYLLETILDEREMTKRLRNRDRNKDDVNQ